MGWLANTVPMHLPVRKISLIRIGCHLLFWLYDGHSFYNTLVRILTVPSTATPPPGPNPYALTVALLDHILTTVFIFYLVGYTVVPILMNQLVYQRTTGRIEWRKMALIVGVILFMFIFYGINNYYLFPFLHQFPHPSPYVERWYDTLRTGGLLGLFKHYDITQFIFAYNFSYVLIPLLLKTIREAVGWGVHSYSQGLRNEQLTFTKLQTLQYQINPHFLFNNFNSIYGLIHKTNKEAAKLLHRLTQILRYTIYETSTVLVPLREEIDFLTNFIMLEKSRRINPDRIEFVCIGNASTFLIPPLLLVTYVENAFKHGLDVHDISGTVQISLNIDTVAKELRFIVQNSVPSTSPLLPGIASNPRAGSGGVGLKNALDRLNVAYGEEYKLQITQLLNSYLVALTLPLR